MAKRSPLTQEEKQYLQRRRQTGALLYQIADELCCSAVTVYKWWSYLRKGQSPRERGRPRKGILSTYPAEVVEEAVMIKRANPHWGPANVKLELQRRMSLSGADLPSDTRLSDLFRARCPEAVQPHSARQSDGLSAAGQRQG
jgi:transposase-like protein